jgi:hypothetical protein
MNYYLRLFTLFVLANTNISTSSAQVISFNSVDDIPIEYDLSDIRKTTFDENNLFIHFNDETIIAIELGSISSNTFEMQQLQINEQISILNQLNLSLFPNPADENLTVNFELTKDSEVTVSLVNSIGISNNLSQDSHFKSGFNSLTICVSDLLPGLYFLQFRVDSNTITKSLIIN